MILDTDLHRYVRFKEESISNALNHIINMKGSIICVVDERNVLTGIFTNGDLLRWLARQQMVDLNKPIAEVINHKFIFASEDTAPEQIEAYLEQVLYVPVVDEHNRLIAVARKRDRRIKIGDFTISDNDPTFVIAEIGINHNGSLDLAKRLIDDAVEAGADCAKFQMRHLESLYSNAGNADDARENLGSQYTLDLLSRFQLSTEQMFEAFDYCTARGILPLCTPWDLTSLDALERYGMQGYKVASADMTNHELLKALIKTRKPLICSTGMSDESEIVQSARLLKQHGAQYVLLQCNSTYPAPFKDVHLRYMKRLQEIGDCPVGYSGHERGIHVPVAAVALGGRVIEKHITVDREMEGNDHKVSLLKDEFRLMIESIRQIEESLGSDTPRQITQGERMNRANLAKSLVINRDLRAGEVITAEMVAIKSPGRGLQPNYREQLVGRAAKRDFQAGDFFYPADLEDEIVQPRKYQFKRPWGVPVRYYDYDKLMDCTNPDFLEFHLSYKDMEQDIHRFFTEPYDMGLVVHSPDLFTGDHLLNLAAEDEAHRQRSIMELQRVVEVTRSLKPYFKHAEKPLIIASLGGFSKDGFVDPAQRETMYARIADSLLQIDQEGVEIIGQTLPPFPWYFGGQLYLNLFVGAKDTAEFCERYGYRLCFDTSHSKLACNHFGWSFKEFIDTIGQYIAHLHIVDAEGVDSEGLQIGTGDIDFPALAEQLQHHAPRASFIPEIWQGHENGGEGFWIALERLEKNF
jgi:sialic acid synthase SpsE/sugar phosphate isomerase/epimerase